MVFIKFHSECNNNCITCRSRNWNKIEFNDIKEEVMNKLKPGVVFDFVGGEPFIKNEIFDLLNIVKSNLSRYRFCSNGRIFFYKDFVEKCHDYLNSVVITFFGDTKEKHDNFTRVNESFEQAFEGLRNLVYFDVKVVCNLYNCGEEFAKKLVDLGVSEIYFTEDGEGEEFVYSCFSDKVKQVKYEFNRTSIPIVFDKVNDFNLDLFNLLIGLKFYLNKDVVFSKKESNCYLYKLEGFNSCILNEEGFELVRDIDGKDINNILKKYPDVVYNKVLFFLQNLIEEGFLETK